MRRLTLIEGTHVLSAILHQCYDRLYDLRMNLYIGIPMNAQASHVEMELDGVNQYTCTCAFGYEEGHCVAIGDVQ